MASLKYVGKAVVADPDLVYRDYVSIVKNADLSADAIDQAINNGLGAYASVTYVDTQDGLLATQAYIDGQDNLRLKLAQKNIANGIAGLDATAKVPVGLINAPMTQKFFRGPWSPPSYGAAADFTTETTILSMGVTDPGFPYKLVVFGAVDAHSSLDAEYPIFQVRVANETTGEIIAVGNGPSDGNENASVGGDEFNRTGSNLGPDWEEVYTESGGGWIKTNGSVAYWEDGGASNHTGKFWRINPDDRYTSTNFQKVTTRIVVTGQTPGGGSDPQQLRLYMRVNDARTQYAVFQITHATTSFFYNNGAGEIQLGSNVGVGQSANTDFVAYAGDPATNNARKFMLYKNAALVTEITDTTAVTTLGTSNRGWGFGERATDRGFGQTSPPQLDFIHINNGLRAFEPTIIVPKDMTVRTGATTLYVRALRSGASSLGSYNPYRPQLHVMAIPA